MSIADNFQIIKSILDLLENISLIKESVMQSSGVNNGDPSSSSSNLQPYDITNIKSFVPLVLDLNKLNYDAWRELFETHCISFGVLGYIDGSIKSSGPDDTEWKKMDSLVKLSIYCTISPSLLTTILKKHVSARDVWLTLESLFHDNKDSRAIQVDSAGDTSITAVYIQILKSFSELLHNLSIIQNFKMQSSGVNNGDPSSSITKELKMQSSGVNNGDPSSSPGLHRFSFAEIKMATNDFSTLFTQVRSANYYKGNISENFYNGNVMVKRGRGREYDDGIPLFQFQKEMDLLLVCDHVNIISLLGYCDEEDEQILVLDFIPNGTLYDHIYNDKEGTFRLNVEQRLEICLGVAKGLVYLHSLSPFHIILRDLTPSNIFLDDNLAPKISEFGCMTHVDGTTSSYEIMHHAPGTLLTDV